MGKTVGELHAMLIEYEKGLPKKAETPQVMMIKGGKIQKSNKKSLKAKVNPVHAYYNGSCTSKDNEDPSWSTSFKTRRTSKTSSALEAPWKTLFKLYLYKIGTFKSHMVLGIAPAAIIDRQLPFEYTITSRSTDVVVVIGKWVLAVCRCLKESKNFLELISIDWLRRLTLSLRVEKKMFVIEQPLPPAPAANSEAMCLQSECFLHELKSMFEKQAGVERFDLIQTFHACKLRRKPVGAYVLKMKDYVEQLERLGYVLPQDLSVGLILNGLTSDFTGFVRNYNMHNMGRQLVNYMQAIEDERFT
ncbi:hypothetical protein Tco_0669931 [Tanacetum coccineum]